MGYNSCKKTKLGQNHLDTDDFKSKDVTDLKNLTSPEHAMFKNIASCLSSFQRCYSETANK